MDEMCAVGVDPSLTGTGVVLSDGRCFTFGAKGITQMSWEQQHRAIGAMTVQVLGVIAPFDPNAVVVETLDVSHAYGGIIPRVILWDALITALYYRYGDRVLLAASTHRMRYATGKGAAKKEEVVDAVARRWPLFATGGDNNKADAAVFCAMGMDWLGAPLVEMPEKHRLALNGLHRITDAPKEKTKR